MPPILGRLFLIDETAHLNPEFEQIIADCHDGAAMAVDFSAQKTVGIVNKWASKHPEGPI